MNNIFTMLIDNKYQHSMVLCKNQVWQFFPEIDLYYSRLDGLNAIKWDIEKQQV